jgi:hypothetical protein
MQDVTPYSHILARGLAIALILQLKNSAPQQNKSQLKQEGQK